MGFTLGVPTSQRSTRSVSSWGVQCDCTNQEELFDLKTVLLIIVISFQTIILLKLFSPTLVKCFRSVFRSKNRARNVELSLANSEPQTVGLDSRTAHIL